MSPRWYLILIFTFSYKLFFPQDHIDSLQKLYDATKSDTARIHLLFTMGNEYVDGPSDSLIHYYDQALLLIDSLISDNDQGMHKIYSRLKFRAILEIGIENYYQGEYKAAMGNYQLALNVASELKDEVLKSEVYEAMAIVLKNQGEYTRALDYYDKALQTAIHTADTFWIATCYVNLGNLQIKLTNYSKAYELLQEGLNYFIQQKHDRRIAVTNLNIGYLFEAQRDYTKAKSYYLTALETAQKYQDNKTKLECLISLGKIYAIEKNHILAKEYYFKAIDLNKKMGFSLILDESYLAIAKIYQEENDLTRAIEYFELSLKIAKEQDDKASVAEILTQLANAQIIKNQLKKAISYAEESLAISIQCKNPSLIMKAYLSLAKAWKKSGENDKALEYYVKYAAYKDTVFNAQKYKSVRDLEMKYEVEKKEQQLELLKEKNAVQALQLSRKYWLSWGALIFTGLLIILAIMLIRNTRLKSRHEAILLEQKLLRSQMNPHFIFNSLIAIQSYIYKKDALLAGDYLAKFAELMRIALDHSRSDFVLLEKEINMLQIYLELQALRFNQIFDFTIIVDPQIDPERIKIPPMLNQPFIENAIEHGLRHKKEKGQILINYQKIDDCLVFSVKDNGVGRLKAAELEINREHRSLATSITRERLSVIGKRMKKHFKIEVIDLKDEAGLPSGTKVILRIPWILKR